MFSFAVPLSVCQWACRTATCVYMQGHSSVQEVILNRGVEIKHVHP